jgi:restriction system protein
MKKYYRVMLGAKSIYAKECLVGGFIGVGFFKDIDLTSVVSKYDEWRGFNKEMIPAYLEEYPEKSKIAAGLACATTWVVSRGIESGDIVLSPNGSGSYMVGKVSGGYSYHPGSSLPHQRKITWFPGLIARNSMSVALKNSTGAIATYCHITKHAAELETLLAGKQPNVITTTDETIEDPTEFALEKHLEDFLIKNWKSTELGKEYDIYEEDGELIGQQYMSDTGPLDILAISKDKQTLLVIELKKGRASDSVVGQIQRYMGYVQGTLLEDSQQVKGVIIALEDDLRIRRALSVVNNIEFYRYQINFKLFKSDT